mgnify:CR=1 FL=1
MSKAEAIKTPAKTGQFDRDDVMRIVHSVISKMEGVSDATQTAVVKELKSLLDVIESIRGDLALTKAHEVTTTHVPSATEELEAVIDTAKKATDDIMNACDAISAVAADNAKALDEVTKIYEACSFQDLTGQRIRKVVGVLKQIEDKVGKLLGILQLNDTGKAEDGREGDAKLLNGPQLPTNAISQEDIDKLLASFD